MSSFRGGSVRFTPEIFSTNASNLIGVRVITLVFLCLFFLQKDPLYSGLMEEENSNSIKQGSKTGTEIRELERIMVINGVSGRGPVKEALMVEA